MVTVSIIPARGGSKGVSRKNIRRLANRPLVSHSIQDALEAKKVDQVYVSTDDKEIADISKQYGAKVVHRPAKLANDTVSSEAALIHAVSEIEKQESAIDNIVFLQCTSPIRTGTDIDRALEKMQAQQADSLLSVSPSHRFLWKEQAGVAHPINYDYRQRPRRQDMSPQYVENGSIYIFKPWVLRQENNRLGGQISLYVMSEESALEIDSLTDFKIIEAIVSEQPSIL
jgi:N-acylneuraminate cytidylyltransferase